MRGLWSISRARLCLLSTALCGALLGSSAAAAPPDTTPPTIIATATPAPDANGWNRGNVTVRFACADAESSIAVCPAPIVVTTEGANQVISGTARDKAGNTATASVLLNIDKTAAPVTAARSPEAAPGGWSAATPVPDPPDPLEPFAVHVHIEFDPSISSKTLKKIALLEATAIWRAYGVELQWTGCGTTPELCLDAIVERVHRHVGIDGAPVVLAHTRLETDPAAHDVIRVSLDAVDAVIEQQHGNATFHDQAVAIALGRVLAHELGHVLLGAPGYHDPVGLMRDRFQTADLVRLDRSNFRLMDRSLARLRARIASFAERQPPQDCGKGEP